MHLSTPIDHTNQKVNHITAFSQDRFSSQETYISLYKRELITLPEVLKCNEKPIHCYGSLTLYSRPKYLLYST